MRSSQTPDREREPDERGEEKTTKRPVRGSQIQKTNANPARPMQPMAAPSASMAATIRPRLVPSKPARALCCFSCASTRLALAGKMAGKARKKPPITGPNRCAISPAMTQTESAEYEADDPFVQLDAFDRGEPGMDDHGGYLTTSQNAKEAANQIGMRTTVAARARRFEANQHPAYACGIKQKCNCAEDHGARLDGRVGFAVAGDGDADGGERDGGSCAEETGEALGAEDFGQDGEEADDDAADQEACESSRNAACGSAILRRLAALS